MPTVERPLREAEFDELFAVGLMDQVRLSPTRLRLRLDPEVEEFARELTGRERECCSFFTFAFAADDGAVLLDVVVPGAHVDVLDALARRATAGRSVA